MLYHGFFVCPFMNVLLIWDIQYNMSNMSVMSHTSFWWGIERAIYKIATLFQFAIFIFFFSLEPLGAAVLALYLYKLIISAVF